MGEAEAGLSAQRLRRRFPSVDFVGLVDDVRPYMRQARLALVPDLLGGFKLKGLDYVFNRLPILAMRIALPGMPLEDGTNIGLFDSHAALADGVVDADRQFPELNARQAAAYDGLCRPLRLAADRPPSRGSTSARPSGCRLELGTDASDICRSVSTGSSGGRKMKL